MLKFPDRSGGDDVPAVVKGLVARWFPGGATAAPLGDGGFSGSPLFLVQPRGNRLHVLKSFAEGTSRSRAEWVHRIALHLHASDAGTLVPAATADDDGRTLVEDGGGRHWEMMTYVEGTPAEMPSQSQIVAAMRALARVHAALATTPEEPPRCIDSRGLTERISRARQLLDHPWRGWLSSRRLATGDTASFVAALTCACDVFDFHRGDDMLRRLVAFDAAPLPCQVVLRDIWSDHVLFERAAPDRVAGIIDLHAMGIDTPATDLARLLGSWLPIDGGIDAAWWDTAVDAYETVRPLGQRERRLVPWLAATGIVFGLDNWFRWTLGEGRVFPDSGRAASRVHHLVALLPKALAVMDALG
jgi:Ser/Thr protein kinase RdoA (MazF antagonist)